MNLIDTVLAMTDEVETPRSYIKWATLAAISAIVKKNVWTEKYAYKVYPNIYVMLVGPPGITKSYATSLSKQMVESINNTKVISGMNSIEGMIQEMGSASLDERGLPVVGTNAFICSNEFTNLLLDNPQAFSVLTELYDACYNIGNSWKKTLKSGKVELKDPYLTMISASNTAHFNDKLRTVDIEGGFIGRTMVVLEKDRHRINSLIRKPGRTFNVTELKDELLRISRLKGEFRWADEKTMSLYETWDMDFKNQTKTDTTGTFRRMPDHVVKVAMLSAIAEGDDLIFTYPIIERAISTCEQLITNIRSVTAGSGSAANSQAIYKFMQDLIGADGYRMDHSMMLKKNYGNFDVWEMAKIVETLTQAKVITMEIIGPRTYYQLTNDAVVNYLRGKES